MRPKQNFFQKGVDKRKIKVYTGKVIKIKYVGR